jgi:hypothetical protein
MSGNHQRPAISLSIGWPLETLVSFGSASSDIVTVPSKLEKERTFNELAGILQSSWLNIDDNDLIPPKAIAL